MNEHFEFIDNDGNKYFILIVKDNNEIFKFKIFDKYGDCCSYHLHLLQEKISVLSAANPKLAEHCLDLWERYKIFL